MTQLDPMTTDLGDFIPTRWSLIKRLKNREDQDSWQEFFDMYWRLIHGTAMKAGLTHGEAQDVVQETVIAVCRNLSKLKTRSDAGSFKGWLLQMTRWRIVDQIRRRRPGRSLSDDEATTSGTGFMERLPDPGGLGLEKIWEDEWRSNLLAAALERVQLQASAKHYQIFYLYVVRGVAVEQIVRVTGSTPNEVYLVKHRLWPIFERAARSIESREVPNGGVPNNPAGSQPPPPTMRG